MKYAEAVAKLQEWTTENTLSPEDAQDMLAAIRDRVQKTNQENLSLRTGRAEMESVIKEVRELLGVSGDENIKDAINLIKEEVSSISKTGGESISSGDLLALKQEQQELQEKLAEAEKLLATKQSEYDASLSTTKGELDSLRRQKLISDVARATNTNESVLSKLISDETEFRIDGKDVLVKNGDKETPFIDFVESNSDWIPFKNSLFVSPEGRQRVSLPKGGTGGTGGAEKDPVSVLIDSTYSVPAHLIEPKTA